MRGRLTFSHDPVKQGKALGSMVYRDHPVPPGIMKSQRGRGKGGTRQPTRNSLISETSSGRLEGTPFSSGNEGNIVESRDCSLLTAIIKSCQLIRLF